MARRPGRTAWKSLAHQKEPSESERGWYKFGRLEIARRAEVLRVSSRKLAEGRLEARSGIEPLYTALQAAA